MKKKRKKNKLIFNNKSHWNFCYFQNHRGFYISPDENKRGKIGAMHLNLRLSILLVKVQHLWQSR